MQATTNNNGAKKPVTREDLIDMFVLRVKENKEQETRLKQGNYFFSSRIGIKNFYIVNLKN